MLMMIATGWLTCFAILLELIDRAPEIARPESP
jgi:hypothetical protein